MRTLSGLLTLLILSLGARGSAQSVMSPANFIRVDQFGYLPSVNKVAVIAKPLEGFNKGAGLRLNVGVPVELVDESSGEVVYAAYAKTWNGGAKDGLSGDSGYWFDFSSVRRAGTYVIRATQLDGATVSSYPFRIAADVYEDVLRATANFFYYQRVNQVKTAEFAAGAPWVDGAWFDRPNQERAARFLDDPSIKRDLSGGWIDAGDPNKYVTFATDPVHSLLRTYTDHPDFWKAFDLNIPESGNAVPDLLDEVQYEIEWIKKMQDYGSATASGGIHQKMGILNDGAYISPPSSDTRLRYYNQVCVSSTITGAGMFAHAAAIYKDFPSLRAEATALIDRAEAAWRYYKAAPNKEERCDDGRIEAGDADGPGDQYAKEHVAEATVAAVYLFEATGKPEYRDFVEANYTKMRPFNGSATEWAVYRTAQGEAIADYAARINPTSAAAKAVRSLKESVNKSESAAYRVFEADNLYRANLVYFNWGSNSLAGAQAAQIMDFLEFGWKPGLAAAHTERAAGILNYIHGTNPMGVCYLSNMYRYGGDLCADEMWHSWFASGTRFDNITGGNVGPAPGFLAGGANPQGNGAMPIKVGTEQFNATVGGQPKQKAFSVNNDPNATFGPWAYNEPAIYYNANYLRALAFFAAGETGGTDAEDFGATGECFEAEAIATTAPPATSQAGTSGGAYLGSTGDAARSMTITPASSGARQITLRVALGDDARAARKSLERYGLSVNGRALALALDSTTLAVASAASGTIWGTAVSESVVLQNGQPVTLRLTATGAGGVDLVCYREPREVPTSSGAGGNAPVCSEAENMFTVLAEAGSNATVERDGNSPGSSGGASVKLFDLGDEARLTFELPAAGSQVLRVRVRTGEVSANSKTNLKDLYRFSLDGTVVTSTLDESTISELGGDTYWGELVIGPINLSAGKHTLDVRALRNWLKLDRFCSQAFASAVVEVPAGAELRLSPNPVQDVLTAEITGVGTSPAGYLYELLDVSGRLVARASEASQVERFDVSSRSQGAGLYTVRVTDLSVGWSIARQVVVQ